MSIRRGGSPRDAGGNEELREATPPTPLPRQTLAAPATPTPDLTPPGTPPPAQAEVPEFLRGAGGSVREGGSIRSASSAPRDAEVARPAVEPLRVTPRRSSATQPATQPPKPATEAGEPSAASSGPGLPTIAWPSLAPPSISIPSGIGAGISVLGLAVVAILSIALLTGQLPIVAGGGGGGGPIKTPTPSNIVQVDPRANVAGTLVYVKDGNLWLQSGESVRQLTSSGRDAMPAWSADGQWIYFIRTTPDEGKWPANGAVRTYDLQIPALVRIHPDGTGIETLLSGRIKAGNQTWQSFIRQPSPSPDGSRVALVTDHPQPWNSDVVLKILNLQTGALVNPQLPEVFPLGHQDPAWSPDGRTIVYVKDARAGTRGTPVIQRFDVASRSTRALTGPGYLSPAWSPDGSYLAATKTGSFGTDIVVLNARTGAELLRVTSDEASFDPVWSPAGDAIAFFRVDHGVVDLELTKLNGSGPNWTLGDTISLTISAGLDAGSRASWFIPPEQMPTPGPSVAASAQPFPTLHGPSQAPSASLP